MHYYYEISYHDLDKDEEVLKKGFVRADNFAEAAKFIEDDYGDSTSYMNITSLGVETICIEINEIPGYPCEEEQ